MGAVVFEMLGGLFWIFIGWFVACSLCHLWMGLTKKIKPVFTWLGCILSLVVWLYLYYLLTYMYSYLS